ncbi:hypothetical protein B0H13DRAFT_1971251, partial [Mycena leptocephala]
MLAKIISSTLLFLFVAQGAMATVCGDPPVRTLVGVRTKLINARPTASCMPIVRALSSMRIRHILLPHTREQVSP